MPRAFLIKNKVKCSTSSSFMGGGGLSQTGEKAAEGESKGGGRGGEEIPWKETQLSPINPGGGGAVPVQQEEVRPRIIQGIPCMLSTPVGCTGGPGPSSLKPVHAALKPSPPGAVPFHGPTRAAPQTPNKLPQTSPPPPPQRAQTDLQWGHHSRKLNGIRSYDTGAVVPRLPRMDDIKKPFGIGAMATDSVRYNFLHFHQQHRQLLMDAVCNGQMQSTMTTAKGFCGSYVDQCPLRSGGADVGGVIFADKPFCSLDKWSQILPHKPQVYRPIPAHPMMDIFNTGTSALFSHRPVNGLPTKSPVWRNAPPPPGQGKMMVYKSEGNDIKDNPKSMPSIREVQNGSNFTISNLVSKSGISEKQSSKKLCVEPCNLDQSRSKMESNSCHVKRDVESKNLNERSLCRPWSNNTSQTKSQGQGREPVNFLGIDFTREQHPRRTMNPPRYQCEACNKSYATFSGLSKHKQFHCVSQIKKQFSCKFCEKNYVSLGALKMHIRTHTLPCKCHLCGKAFSRPWLLQGHVRTHTGEKPFQCSHCGRSFADRSNLRAHLQTHTDIKKYNCRNCSKTFSRMSLLLKHQDGGCPGSV